MRTNRLLNKSSILCIGMLMLSGCSDNMFISQEPIMNQFIGKTPEQIYQQAEDARLHRQYNMAISNLRAFLRLYFEHQKAEMVRVRLIECYVACGQFQKALKEVETFLRLYPDSEHYDTLKNKEQMLKRKNKMDRFYHLAWLQDIKKQHKTSYYTLAKQFDGLKQ